VATGLRRPGRIARRAGTRDSAGRMSLSLVLSTPHGLGNDLVQLVLVLEQSCGYLAPDRAARKPAPPGWDRVAPEDMMKQLADHMRWLPSRGTVREGKSMSEQLLQELEASAPVLGSLENIKDLVRVVARDVGMAIEGMKGSARTFENCWRRIVLDVAKGRTAEIQVLHPRLLAAFEKRLRLLKEIQLLAKWLRELDQADVPEPEALLPEIAGMERMKASVSDLWQNADDLEELAARDYPLTTADLDQIGPGRRPSESWYAEESKPL
jgi:hypothetical protein